MAANIPAAPNVADATPTSHSRVLARPRCSTTGSFACSLARTTRRLAQRRPPCPRAAPKCRPVLSGERHHGDRRVSPGVAMDARLRRAQRALAIGVVCASLGTSCGNQSAPSIEDAQPVTTIADDVAYVRSTMQGRLMNAHLGGSARPLREYLVDGVFDQVVLGTVVGGGFGVAYRLPDGDGPSGAPDDGQTRVEEDSPDAAWKTVHVQVKVESHLDPGQGGPDQVTAGFVVAPKVSSERFVRGLTGFGRVVLFLDAGSPVFDYDPSVLAVGREGSLVAQVADDGRLSVPFMEAEPEVMRDSETLDALRLTPSP